jgi:hypothetical protein
MLGPNFNLISRLRWVVFLRLVRCTLVSRTAGTHWIGGAVGPRTEAKHLLSLPTTYNNNNNNIRAVWRSVPALIAVLPLWRRVLWWQRFRGICCFHLPIEVFRMDYFVELVGWLVWQYCDHSVRVCLAVLWWFREGVFGSNSVCNLKYGVFIYCAADTPAFRALGHVGSPGLFHREQDHCCMWKPYGCV